MAKVYFLFFFCFFQRNFWGSRDILLKRWRTSLHLKIRHRNHRKVPFTGPVCSFSLFFFGKSYFLKCGKPKFLGMTIKFFDQNLNLNTDLRLSIDGRPPLPLRMRILKPSHATRFPTCIYATFFYTRHAQINLASDNVKHFFIFSGSR